MVCFQAAVNATILTLLLNGTENDKWDDCQPVGMHKFFTKCTRHCCSHFLYRTSSNVPSIWHGSFPSIMLFSFEVWTSFIEIHIVFWVLGI